MATRWSHWGYIPSERGTEESTEEEGRCLLIESTPQMPDLLVLTGILGSSFLSRTQESGLFPQSTHLAWNPSSQIQILSWPLFTAIPHSSHSRHNTGFEWLDGVCGLATHINVNDRTLWMKKINCFSLKFSLEVYNLESNFPSPVFEDWFQIHHIFPELTNWCDYKLRTHNNEGKTFSHPSDRGSSGGLGLLSCCPWTIQVCRHIHVIQSGDWVRGTRSPGLAWVIKQESVAKEGKNF